MEGLEAAGEPYCVIGHSHGGSVATHALLLAASKQQALPRLARCITVGTPYIVFTKSRWLFTRSKLLEKAVLVSVAAYTLFFLIFLFFGDEQHRRFSKEALFFYALLSGPFLTLYIGLRWINAKRYLIYQPAVLKFLQRTYGARILSLRHEDDEAINALRSMRHLQIPFFGRDFAVPALSLLSLFIVPVAFVFLAQSQTFLRAVDWSPFGITELESNWLKNSASVITNLSLTIGDAFYRSLYWIASGPSFHPPVDPIAFSLFLGAVGGTLILALLSLPVTSLAVAAAKLVSSGMSRLLNPLTWSLCRSSAPA